MNTQATTSRLLAAITLLAIGWAGPDPASAATPLRSLCRIKGQEENSLHGLGIVVGLKGTGDGGNFLPTIRSLALALELMGSPIGQGGSAELKDAKNVALVTVTATVPATGARQGDRIDCVVSSVGSAKSLAGGRLFLTPLMGPIPQDNRVYALAEGALRIEDVTLPTTGRIHGGCRLEEEFFNVFSKDGKITLVLNESHADFRVAQSVAELINSRMGFQSNGAVLSKALDQVNIEVEVPAQYRNDLVLFVSQILELPVLDPQTGPRVTINQRAGSIVIGGDVEIGPVVVSHKNLVVETGGNLPGQFVALDPGQTQAAKLKSLVETLNALHVPTADIIDIIKTLDRNGKLHAQLVIE